MPYSDVRAFSLWPLCPLTVLSSCSARFASSLFVSSPVELRLQHSVVRWTGMSIPIATIIADYNSSGHIFCAACLMAHRRTSRSCPSCRTDILRIIGLRNLEESGTRNATVVFLDAEMAACLRRLIAFVEDHINGVPITLETLSAMLSV